MTGHSGNETIVVNVPEKKNGEKELLYRVLFQAVTIILLLVGTVWAVTWKADRKEIDATKVSVAELKTFCDQQMVLNEQQKSTHKTIDRKLDAILNAMHVPIPVTQLDDNDELRLGLNK
jgi:hypothetical protein